jgi:hypothetical protein
MGNLRGNLRGNLQERLGGDSTDVSHGLNRPSSY